MTLVSLRDHDDRAILGIEVIDLDARDLGSPEARMQPDRDDRTVAQVDWTAAVALARVSTHDVAQQARREDAVLDLDGLIAIEDIKVLRARYCRLVDTKDWPGFRDLFTDDMVFVDDAKSRSLEGADAFMAYVTERHATSVSVHVATNPEIEVTGPESATGIWAQHDYVEVARGNGRMVQRGWGSYHELYRREDGVWKIASVRLKRIHMEITEVR